jgi:geranylgeranyl pyrophosphate synthase
MKGGMQIRELFSQYGEMFDIELSQVLQNTPSYDMYKHMAYFMGFANENLEEAKSYGGKRFRSGLALLLGEFYGVLQESLPAALSLELFHNFTLIHDDIVDKDTFRRGRPTVWKLFGVDNAINDGDAQMLLSLQVVLENNFLSAEQKILLQSFLLKQYLHVSEGQYLDFTLTKASLGDRSVNESAYLKMVGRKTADLIAASTSIAGLVAGVSKTEQEALFTYGYELGVAYQLCDDVVSIWGTSEQTGKRVRGDILERKKTLPILWWYANATDSNKEEIRLLYDDKTEMTSAEAEKVVSMLDSANTYEVMMERVRTEAAAAHSAVASLSLDKKQRETLSHIVDTLLIDIKDV